MNDKITDHSFLNYPVVYRFIGIDPLTKSDINPG